LFAAAAVRILLMDERFVDNTKKLYQRFDNDWRRTSRPSTPVGLAGWLLAASSGGCRLDAAGLAERRRRSDWSGGFQTAG
jgi:hypothetical protein